MNTPKTGIPRGFQIRVGYMARNLPYPVQVFLPAIVGTSTGPTVPRCKGPELDIVVPTDDFRHTALGLFMDSWSLLESQLHFLMSKLLGVDLASTGAVMATLGIKQIIDLMIGLGKIKLVRDDAEALVNLTERLSKLNTKRNTLVHGHWVLEANVMVKSGEAVLRTQFLRELTPLDPKEAQALANPRNQKQRMRFCFTPKRIIGVVMDVENFQADTEQFIDALRFLSPSPG